MSTIKQNIKKAAFYLIALGMVAAGSASLAPATVDACVTSMGSGLYVEYYPGDQNPSTGETSSGGGWAAQDGGFVRVVSVEYAQQNEVCDVGGGGGPELYFSVDINADPMVITQGDSSELSWSTSLMSSCSIDQGIGSVTPDQYGSRMVTPAQTTEYTLSCTGLDAMPYTDSVTVTVNPPPPPVATLSVSPTTAAPGSSATLTYSCTNSTSGSISPTVGAITADGASHTASTGALTRTQQYTLTCTGAAGSAQAYATVNVLSVELTADPGNIVLGTESTLTWHSTYAESCMSPDFDTSGDTSGTIAVSPTATTTYTVTCSRAGITTSGNWVHQPEYDDMSDLTCPISGSAMNRIYSGVPNCPSGASTGAACSGSSTCKINRSINANGSSGCFVETKMYRCEGGGSTPTQSVSDTATVTVTTQGQGVDLTAGAVTPTQAPVNTATTFHASVVNLGVDSTGTGFPVLFQRATSAGGANTTDQGYSSVAFELEGGAQIGVSRSITLPSAGTWYLRVCADKNASAHAGVIDESNETNNCGPWTPITACTNCGPDDDDGYVTCEVSASSVTPGSSVTYTATPHDGASAPFTWTAPNGETGFGNAATATRTFTAVGSYEMEVRASGASRAASCPVVVVGLCPGTPVVNLTADQARVNAGQSTTLNWDQITAVSKSCKVVRGSDGAMLFTATATSCTVPGGSVSTGPINTQTTFSMVCDEAVRDTVIVNVVPNWEEF